MDANLTLVGATRHKLDLEIYTSDFKSIDAAGKSLSRSDYRLELKDYSINSGNKEYFERVSNFRETYITRVTFNFLST